MPSYYQWGLVWNLNGNHRGFSRFVSVSDSDPDDSVRDSVWDAIHDSFNGDRTWCSSEVTLNFLTMQKVTFVPASGGYRFHPTTVQASRGDGTVGAGSSAMSSPQVCYRVTLRTLLPGKSYRGRIFLPGVPEGKVDGNGIIDTDVQTSAGAFVSGVVSGANDALSAISGGLVVPSFKHGTVEVIRTVEVQRLVGTQRRRLKRTDPDVP